MNEIDSKQTIILMKIETCLPIFKISIANQKTKILVKCLSLPKRNLELWERKP